MGPWLITLVAFATCFCNTFSFLAEDVEALFQNGEEALVRSANRSLPIEISGANFTLERLNKYFTVAEKPKNKAGDHPNKQLQDENVKHRQLENSLIAETKSDISGRRELFAWSAIFKGFEVLCSAPIIKSICDEFKDGGGDEDVWDKQYLNVDVEADGSEWNEIEGWSSLRRLDGGYFLWENGFGTDVIEVWYHWQFYYGGRLGRGDVSGGAFIKGATIVVSFSTGFLFDVDIHAFQKSVRNIGTVEAPIAAVDLVLEVIAGGAFNSDTRTCTATITGNGESWVHNGCPGGNTGADSTVNARVQYLSSGSGSNAKSSDADGCFDSRSIVHLADDSNKIMSELRLGDMVEVTPGVFEPVLLLPKHWTKNGRTNLGLASSFQHIECTSGAWLTLTAAHQIYATTNVSAGLELVRADQIKEGDWLMSQVGLVSVKSNKIVESDGLFTPYTRSLKIMVGGIQSSCLIDHPILNTFAVQVAWYASSLILGGLLNILGSELYGILVDSISSVILEPFYYYPGVFTLIFVASLPLLTSKFFLKR